MAGLASEDKLKPGEIGTTPQATEDSGPSPHKYEPLPTATSIRLLKILPSPTDQVWCELKTFDLDNDISFDALSYTWGDPITLYERPDEEFLALDPENHSSFTKDQYVELLRKTGVAEFGDAENDGPAIDLDAFTYRMSYPLIPYEKVANSLEKTRFITCNGNTMLVTDNLFEALYMFRKFVMKEVKASVDEYTHIFTRPFSMYLWVDAICINQEDREERNSQVMLMGRIYSLAQNVFCWIGKTDIYSKLGVSTLGELFEMVLENPGLQDQRYETLHGIQGISIRKWLSLFAILQRLWFRRAWIIQELVFASRVTLMCGSNIFRWLAIETVLQFLEKTRLDDKLSETVQNLMRRSPFLKLLKMMKKAALATANGDENNCTTTTPKHILSVNPKAIYSLAANVRRLKERLGIEFEYLCHLPQDVDLHTSKLSLEPIGSSSWTLQANPQIQKSTNNELCNNLVAKDNCFPSENPYPKIVIANGLAYGQDNKTDKFVIIHIDPGPQPPISLLSIIATFRVCGASDPRDKIFAFLNLAAKGRALSEPDHIKLEVDYASSIQNIYIAAARFILETSGLNVLSHVQDQILTKVDGLPSWVPDFSVDIGRSIIEVEESSPWASSGDNHLSAFKISQENCLILEGVMVDIVSDVIGLKGCYFERISKLALKTPQWYLNNHGLPPTFNLYCLDVLDKERSPLLLPSLEDSDFPCISRVEALWRTLIGDSFKGVYPAPASCGFGFSDWITLHLERAEKLAGTTTVWEKRPEAQRKYIQHWMARKFALWKALENDEKSGFYTLEEIKLAKQKSQKSSSTSPQLNATIEEIDGHGLRYLPDIRRLLQVFKREVHTEHSVLNIVQTNNFNDNEKARLSAFETRKREMKRGRRLFRTRIGYLGMGPLSTELGDQVWVLKGANVPFVLRKVGNGRFKLIGETYVHGIMKGEALRGGTKFREVVLE